ncbi:DUF4232 domain-containing protein [Pseudonocardia phyllosphaerae]|uniref:DUF4232 domain-containing protein n=1 Tax=Pseudonocardia phyllosphaerae TaxID=3390502 RepID=UPI00397C964E
MDHANATITRRTARWAAALAAGGTVLSALLAGGSVASAAEPTGNGPDEGVGRCHTSELAGSLNWQDSAAGSNYALVNLTNNSDHTCYVFGTPNVEYVTGDDGARVGAPADRIGESWQKVWLEPGRTSSAQLRATNVDAYDPADCNAVETRGFRVQPYGEPTALFIPEPGKGCTVETGPAAGQLQIKAFGES